MPSVDLLFHKTGDPPVIPDVNCVLHDRSGKWTAVVIEGGMGSGNPSVALVIKTPQGDVIVETSLLAFNAAARGLVAMAETQFGWEMPP